MFYVYRTTTDKLGDAMTRITQSGDTINWPPVFVGGRDWVMICRKVDGTDGRELDHVRRQIHEPRQSTAELRQIKDHLARIERAVAQTGDRVVDGINDAAARGAVRR